MLCGCVLLCLCSDEINAFQPLKQKNIWKKFPHSHFKLLKCLTSLINLDHLPLYTSALSGLLWIMSVVHLLKAAS